jgi:[acyl-carrier-protein] S-malonyltransferase
MGKAICEEIPAAKALYDKASNILGYDLLAKCQGSKEELDSTVISQPAIFVASMAAVEKLKAENPEAIGAPFSFTHDIS